MNDQKNKIITAVLISLALHAAFFAVSRHIVLPGMSGSGEDARKIFRVKDVDKTPKATELFSDPETLTALPDKQPSEPLIEAVTIEHEAAVFVEREDLIFERKKEKMVSESDLDKTSPRKDAIRAEDLSRSAEQRALEKSAPETRALGDIVLSRGPSSFSDAPRISADETEYVEQVPASGHAVESSLLAGDRTAVSAQDGDRSLEETVERVGKYEDMTSYLEVDLKTFRNPSTGEKFFRANIGVRKGVKIEAMPKDVVFLIDSSKSVTERRFEQVKRGLSAILRDLDEKDTFNIIAFKQGQEQFADNSIKATSGNIRNGRDFVNALTADGRTDIEGALLQIARSVPRQKPSYVFLVSDGRPTTGVTNIREIIKKITRENLGRRPIFSFGAGLRVNTYLLDFLSYQNRAWSEFAVASDSAARDVRRLYDDISEPLLTDLRYRMSGMVSQDVYPKELPDFYHAKGLTVYGKYWDEDTFSMQVLGETYGTVKEFIFKRKLSEAEQGDEGIERAWAFNKIYHLIGMETMGKGDPEVLVRQIESLSRRYGIRVPHIEEQDADMFDEEE
ncbi:MAG: VWA domain-containing protein [Candidatus Omnitrophota bacterium]